MRFCPRENATSQSRVEMDIDELDRAKVGRGEIWYAEITDRISGKRYKVRGADCGYGHCFCDAVIVSVLEDLRV